MAHLVKRRQQQTLDQLANEQIITDGIIEEVTIDVIHKESTDGSRKSMSKSGNKNTPTLQTIDLLENMDTMEASDAIEDPLAGICQTPECIAQLQQYMEWRQQNGYPVPSGRWGK
jgi:hypothetical protein